MENIIRTNLDNIYSEDGQTQFKAYDIIVDLRQFYGAATSSEIKEKALELIELEQDLKYKKKYATVWKKA